MPMPTKKMKVNEQGPEKKEVKVSIFTLLDTVVQKELKYLLMFPKITRHKSGRISKVEFLQTPTGDFEIFMSPKEIEANIVVEAEYRYPEFSASIVKEIYELLTEEPFYATMLQETIISTRGPVVGHKVEIEPEKDEHGNLIFDDDGLPILTEKAEIKPKEISTACIWFDPKASRFRTYYNPTLLKHLKGVEKKDIIMHEHMHALFKHVGPNPMGLRKLTEDDKLAKKWNNIAHDLAINSHLEHLSGATLVLHEWVEEWKEQTMFEPEKFRAKLSEYKDIIHNYEWIENASNEDLLLSYALLHRGPFSGCVPGKTAFKEFPSHLTSEAYFYLLQEREKEKGKEKCENGDRPRFPSGSGSSFDIHISQEELDEGANSEGNESTEIARVLEKARNASKAKGWGSVSAETQQDLDKFLSKEVSWEKQLEFFVRKSGKANHYSTFKKMNKRYRGADGFSQAPGRKIARTSKVHVFIDESGSVDNRTLEKFFAVLRDLSRYTSFVLIPFDTEVKLDHKVVWEKGNPYKDVPRVACGGTSFQCVTDYCNQNKSEMDGYIIFTDFLAPQPTNSMIHRIWIGSEYDANNCRFQFRQNEKVVRIKNDEN